jgi:RNA polymerase sigma factor (sigma-70 family)
MHCAAMNIASHFLAYFPKLVTLLRRRGQQVADAKDLAQEAYVRLLDYMQAGRQVLEPEAFLVTVALNLVVDRNRRTREHLFDVRPVEELNIQSHLPSTDDVVAAEARLLQMVALLDRTVGETAREAFLCTHAGMTQQEIADQIGKDVRTVQRYIVAANKVVAETTLE